MFQQVIHLLLITGIILYHMWSELVLDQENLFQERIQVMPYLLEEMLVLVLMIQSICSH